VLPCALLSSAARDRRWDGSLLEEQKFGSDQRAATVHRRAGFWARGAAAIIDLLILGVPLAVFVSFLSVGMGISNQFLDLHPGMEPHEILRRFGPRFMAWSFGFFVLTDWLYFALLESSKWRATPGKRLLGIHVADELGRQVTFWRASRRFLGGRLLVHVPYVGIYYFLVDCAYVGLKPGKRAIHDVLSGCLVLREGVE
jgi:uncharacterized RDD family membrane protein YckC